MARLYGIDTDCSWFENYFATENVNEIVSESRDVMHDEVSRKYLVTEMLAEIRTWFDLGEKNVFIIKSCGRDMLSTHLNNAVAFSKF